MEKLNVGMVSLGCDKNRVDAELMLGVLPKDRYNIVNNEEEADVIIINTCGFIESAKKESINTILELAQYKSNGRCKVLIASGCLAERYSDELLTEIPELNAVVGVGNYMEIESIIDEVLNEGTRIKKTQNINYDVNFSGKRILTTPLYTAYVKIAEGCNNRCSYCIIPKLRGNYRSRSMHNILKEVEELVSNGTKEIILVAQDTTKYGIDLYGKSMLPELLRSISDISGVEWIRLLYCYPEDITDELINEIKTNKKICKYIDMPLQHVSDRLLADMKRLSRKKDIEKLIIKLRNNIPDIVIRTSLIVGFPGETEDDFEELYNFLEEFKLDRVGIFTYSQEEGTDAASFDNQVEERIKKMRQRKLLSLQKRISRDKNKKKVGNTFKVLVDSIKNDNTIVGRTYGDAPEIDGVVYVKLGNEYVIPGDFINVKITDSFDYDLLGVVDSESCK